MRRSYLAYAEEYISIIIGFVRDSLDSDYCLHT